MHSSKGILNLPTSSLPQSPSIHLFSKIIRSRFTTPKIKLGEDSPSWFVFSRFPAICPKSHNIACIFLFKLIFLNAILQRRGTLFCHHLSWQYAVTATTKQRVISSSRPVFMNENSGRIRALLWHLMIVYRSHNNKNDHLTRPWEGPGLNAWVSTYHYPRNSNKQLLLL